MAKAKKSEPQAMAGPMDNDEWQAREDVDRLMRADEVHADPKRLERAHTRITGVAERIASHKKSRRSKGRSSGR